MDIAGAVWPIRLTGSPSAACPPWRASYTADDGMVYYATRTFDAKVDAEGWLANERKLLDIGEWTPPETRVATKAAASITLHDYAEKWLEQRDLTPKTRALYKDLLKSRIEPQLGDETLRAVTPAMARIWWIGLGKETPTRNTHAYQLLKAIYNTAVGDKGGHGESMPDQGSREAT